MTLKPCPFCGRAVSFAPEDDAFIICTKCDVIGPGDCRNTVEAVEAWNRRPREEALEAENQRLRDALANAR